MIWKIASFVLACVIVNAFSAPIKYDFSRKDLTKIPSAINSHEGNDKLVNIDLTHNQIRTVEDEITCCMYVNNMLLSHNSIASVTLSSPQNMSIVTLDLSQNCLSEMPNIGKSIAGNIQNLILNHNNISSIAPEYFNYFNALVELKISYNGLTHFPIFPPENNVANIIVNGNKIGGFNKANLRILPKLKWLSLEDNLIKDFPDLSIYGKTLEYISLKTNGIRGIPGETFDPLVSLATLDVSENPLKVFPNLTSVGDTLLQLHIWSTPIKEIPSELLIGLQKLRELHMTWNELTYLPNFGPLCSILERLDLDNFKSRQKLTIGDTLTCLTSLSLLHLQGTYQSEFPLLPTTKGGLRVNLNHNTISDIPLGRLKGKNIIELKLIKNEFTSFPDLSPIGSTLEKLYLSHNKGIIAVNLNDVEKLISLKRLALSGTSISTLPDLRVSTQLRTLNLLELTLTCDCQLAWIKIWESEGNILSTKSTICNAPENLKGQAFSAVQQLCEVSTQAAEVDTSDQNTPTEPKSSFTSTQAVHFRMTEATSMLGMTNTSSPVGETEETFTETTPFSSEKESALALTRTNSSRNCWTITAWNDVVVNTTLTVPGTYASYTCSPGFSFNDGQVTLITHCMDLGYWAPPIQRCQDSTETIQSIRDIFAVPKEAPMAVGFGIVAYIIVGVEFGFFVMLDLSIYRTNIKIARRNVRSGLGIGRIKQPSVLAWV